MKIEKNIPIPEDPRGRRPRGTYSDLVRSMEVGDSFLATGDNFGAIQSAVRNAAKRINIKITTRRISDVDDEIVQVRVWRVKDEAQDVAKEGTEV